MIRHFLQDSGEDANELEQISYEKRTVEIADGRMLDISTSTYYYGEFMIVIGGLKGVEIIDPLKDMWHINILYDVWPKDKKNQGHGYIGCPPWRGMVSSYINGDTLILKGIDIRELLLEEDEELGAGFMTFPWIEIEDDTGKRRIPCADNTEKKIIEFSINVGFKDVINVKLNVSKYYDMFYK